MSWCACGLDLEERVRRAEAVRPRIREVLTIAWRVLRLDPLVEVMSWLSHPVAQWRYIRHLARPLALLNAGFWPSKIVAGRRICYGCGRDLGPA